MEPARPAVQPLPWSWFRHGRPIMVARAPGRLDVMGGIADYSGATVLELPLALGAMVGAQETDDGMLAARTDGPAVPSLARAEVAIPISVLCDGPAQEAPERLRAALEEANALWAAYVLGPLAILQADGLAPALGGLRVALWSEVPAGAGISSSAAIEVASLRALAALSGGTPAPMQLARAAQRAEHRVALAPCGIMDQATATLGRRDHLLLLRCQPAEVLGQKPLPRDARVVGIDSAVAHRVAGAQYGRVRTAAFMGRSIIAAADPGQPPDGYLCNLALDRFEDLYAPHLPLEMRGSAFLARYGETGDDATRVDPDMMYRIRDCTSHPVHEQANVETFLAALDRYAATGNLEELATAGTAMRRSHESYGRRCGLGTPETDLLVELVSRHGQEHGLFGAKITGGGSGGTVAVLGAGPEVQQTVTKVAAEYTHRTGNVARVIADSGDGALASPVTRVIVDQQGVGHVS